jgi:transglutaminase-like putative cysteine protease
MYHKLAMRDPSLHLVMAQENRIEVYLGEGGRTLCWFDLDANGALLRWGNFYQSEKSEHVYGPIKPVGEFQLPAWGTSTSGAWRFEYLDARSVNSLLD